MKILIIGPLKPLRGGIAHSNEILIHNLKKNHEVINISFSTLFPKFLYPGKFQNETNKKSGTLNSLNPINWKNHAKKINKLNPDLVIFQWWTSFLSPCYSFLASNIKSKKIAMCQNIFPHSEGKLKKIINPIHKFLSKQFLSKMNKLIAMSKSDLKKIKNIFPTKKTGLYLEPVYEIEGITTKISKSNAKKQLKITEKNVLLFFGFVREYKGLKYLLKAMPEIIKVTNARLLIVGEFWQNKKEYLKLIKKEGIKKNITIVDEYVPNEKIPIYFNASDLLILPYLDISESGIIRMAFNFNLPILSTNVGGNPDHITNEFNGYLVQRKNSEEIAQKTIDFFKKNKFKEMSKAMKIKKQELKWSGKKENEIIN